MNEVTRPVQKIGKVSDAHGIRGELYVILFINSLDWLSIGKEVRIHCPQTQQDRLLTVERFRPHKKGLILSFKEMRDRNQAEELKGSFLLLDHTELTSKSGENIYLREILNFDVESPPGTSIGTIIDFSSNLAQDLIVIQLKNLDGKCEVPLVKDFIVKLDFENGIIQMNLPEGLVEALL